MAEDFDGHYKQNPYFSGPKPLRITEDHLYGLRQAIEFYLDTVGGLGGRNIPAPYAAELEEVLTMVAQEINIMNAGLADG